MNALSLSEWERHHSDQGTLCTQCTSLFSTFKSLRSLTSPQGRTIDFKRFFQSESTLTCPLCVLIRETIYPNHHYYLAAPLFAGRRKDLRLKVECEADVFSSSPSSFPFPNHIFQRPYPSNITSIRHVTLVLTLGEDLPYGKYFLVIYRPLGAPSAYPLHCYPQGNDMLCDLYMEKAKRKLDECKVLHDRCKDLTPLLPTRVIDVGTSDRHPKLYTCQVGERSDYAVLSYCWGGPQPMTTTQNVAAMTERLLPISQSVNDAIQVTRKLGLRYLWVDAICIIQDDVIDKSRELKFMEQIYTTATLTICASNFPSAEAGFVSTQPPKGCELPFRLPDGSFTSVTVIPCNKKPPEGHFPIDSRAWTFQERILSARLLIFGFGELKWQCLSSDPKYITNLERTEKRNAAGILNVPGDSGHSRDAEDTDDSGDWESVDSDDSDDSNDSTDSVKDPEQECLTPHVFENEDHDFFFPHSAAEIFHSPRTTDLWHDIVREYSCREHTVPQDRVHAIGGIIRALEIAWSDTCIAGLWRSRLVENLFWKINERREGRKKLHWKRSDLYVAPSWSWLSVPEAVCYRLIADTAGDKFFCPTAQIVECSVGLVDGNLRLGEMREGRIVLRTTVLPAPGRGPDDAPGVYVEQDEAEQDELDTDNEHWNELDLDSDADTDSTDTWGRADMVFAKLGFSNIYKQMSVHRRDLNDSRLGNKYVIGLILEPVNNGVFRRVGTFQPDPDEDGGLPWEEGEERTVTVI